MDYSLAAVKMFISHLKPAKPATELTQNGGTAFAIGSLVFQRAWLQGVLVQGADKGSFFLQDGTGSIPLQMGAESWKPGMYVLVVGAYLIGADGSPFVLVHKIVDLSSSPGRDKFWRLEVAEVHNLFYNKLINASTH
ncbi:uncharacterized protein [Physcomitrium patens]|uniref:RecQ-mediated genome instability protein 2 n=1 Tax=Physcomitrium patens TaxID=3218 RepID=A0A2K1IBW2_PHYPA|nr:recQ-mediated genome instability protein 2-like [Physcomitrium patens]PNR26759.1 hypothetical protein PHYPA_030240 [Physcomitrium patens]|eukprot:XP_024366845.1 recQ-mediated genome instability protein 2-like [Physcomitrella patens]